MQYFLNRTHNLRSSDAPSEAKTALNKVAGYIDNLPDFSTETDYNRIIHDVATMLQTISLPLNLSLFQTEIHSISQSLPLTEKTVWGGVVYKYVDVENDSIKKLLVIKKSGILGFEIHKKKQEYLQVLEGYCLVFFSNHKKKNWKPGEISLKLAHEGDTFHFEPGDEHGMIAITDCVIEERSTNHLTDLVYIFKSSQT